MKKILVTGGSGFVGSRFVHRWQGEYEILAPRHGELDITDADAVAAYLAMHRPDVLLHIAAIADTGYCQEHPQESYLVNTLATVHLAQAARMTGAKFVFFSSDQVYNGTTLSGLLPEDAPLSPQNHYACHKLEAEERVLDLLPNAVLLRATWMYDIPRPSMPVHPNFFTNICHAIAQGSTLSFATHEHRGITHVSEVVEQLPRTFHLPGGAYNYGAENHLNTYETALAFLTQWKGREAALSTILPDEQRFASQPRNISISLDKIHQASQGQITFSNTLEGLMKRV